MLKFSFDNKFNTLFVLNDSDVISSFYGEEIETFFESLSIEKDKYLKRSFSKESLNFKEKLYLDYIKTDVEIEAYSLEDVVAVNIEILRDPDCVEVKSEAILNDDKRIYIEDGISDNILSSWDRVPFRYIRASLGDDLLEHMKKNSEFELRINDKSIPREFIFDDSKNFMIERIQK